MKKNSKTCEGGEYCYQILNVVRVFLGMMGLVKPEGVKQHWAEERERKEIEETRNFRRENQTRNPR